jgi:predicted dehydrogenase
LIDQGALGRITSAQVTTWFRKPDDYFDVEWRKKAGGGPIAINLIHDIDLLRHLIGPIEELQAFTSNAARKFEVEDSAVVSLRFRSGALGTVNLSDVTPAPWSWELTSGENRDYPATQESTYLIGGTAASISLPHLALWRHEGSPSWWNPITATVSAVEAADPLIRQIGHFARVIEGVEHPRVSAVDGLAALAAIEAIKHSAATGRIIRPDSMI